MGGTGRSRMKGNYTQDIFYEKKNDFQLEKNKSQKKKKMKKKDTIKN